MRNTAIWLLCFFLCPTAISLAVVRLQAEQPASEAVWGRRQFRVHVDASFQNPFDPEEIRVDATFQDASGHRSAMPAFWMTRPDGSDGDFFVRFAPPTAGRWQLHVESVCQGRHEVSETLAFNVKAGNRRGVVQRAAANPRYFQYSNGVAYFPIGPNIAWGIDQALASYEPMFAKLGEAGGNFARVWMSDPNFRTESAAVGLGRYDQTACANYDAIFESAERHGIACMVTFNNYRDLRIHDEWGDCLWPSLPYTSSNGGPCTQPSEFISLPVAQKLYRQRLRYIVGRYGAFTSIAFWELFNEQDHTQVNVPASWVDAMASYLRSVDPYGRIATTSFAGDADPAVWRLDSIGLAQRHSYGGPDAVDCVGTIVAMASRHRDLGKPFLVSELGISWQKPDIAYDDAGTGTNIHNSLWAAMMSGCAGGASNWWWDNYIDPKNLWPVYRGAAAFSQQIDWPRRDFRPVHIALLEGVSWNSVDAGAADLDLLAMHDTASGETIAWLHDRSSNWRNDLEGKLPRTLPPIPINLPAALGDYEIQWWDTRAGKMLKSVGATAADGKLSLLSPPILRDVALRAVRRSAGSPH